ncbi:E3 SUMO-protein ligase KIAA1586 [Merluccius polli]|uniref:E3 SUMO-protein ligase KIAA1586 n=1 Tax=Merluccius polli TaxID=89951 RepID=A0AA47NP99_MERPO|nr:E3 SUMO-protein ligase KIAA1586 [Merluccius polli]
MKLNELNGAKVGPAHRSDHSCAAIVEHIADEMKKKLVSHILTLDSRISITLDESTIHGRSYMIIYIRCDVTGNGDVENVFFDIVELDHGDAESLHNALKNSLHLAGVNAEFLKRIATDGAAVLTGRQTGLIERLKQDFPQLQSVHCLAHRLELAVADSLKILYSLYHQSTKNAKELEKAAADLNMQILKIGKIFTIRWVSSSFRTVKAVLKDFPVLARHFRIATEDNSYTGADRAKYAGLLKHLTSTGFVSDLAVMKDVLRELQGLSLRLQRRETSLVDASRHIHQTIEVLAAMKEIGGKTESKIQASITSGQLKNVVLRETQPKINKGQFYQSIIDNLKKRLPDSELVAMLKPLNAHFWPSDRSELVLFGEHEVGKFAKLLGEPATEAVNEYRDWKLQGSQSFQGKTLKKLIIASSTVLPTSAECERGFSACNDTDDKTRNRLRAQSLTALLFIDLNGPPIENFNPVPFVKSWIKKGHRTSASWIPGRRAQPAESRAVWSILSP